MLLFLFAFPALLVSQDVAFPILKGYKLVTSDYPVYTPDNLWDFIDGAAETYLSYKFENLYVAEYKRGKNVIKLEIYKHSNNIQAFGIYSSERSPAFDFINIGAQGYKTDGSLNFFKGKYYVKLRTYSGSSKTLQSLRELAIEVAEILPGEYSMPKAITEFPDKGKTKNSESYINENVLGHEFLGGAFKALYEIGDTEFSVFIIDKGSPDETRAVVKNYLSKAGVEFEDQSEGKYVFKDGYNGDIFLTWKDNRIVLIEGLAKDQAEIADKYTSEILRLNNQ